MSAVGPVALTGREATVGHNQSFAVPAQCDEIRPCCGREAL